MQMQLIATWHPKERSSIKFEWSPGSPRTRKIGSDSCNALGQLEIPLTNCILISQLNADFYVCLASKGVSPSCSLVPPKQKGISYDGLSVLISGNYSRGKEKKNRWEGGWRLGIQTGDCICYPLPQNSQSWVQF